MQVRIADNRQANTYFKRNHYLHRPVIRSKLLAYWVYDHDDVEAIDAGVSVPAGCVMWATPHFIKKNGLFGKKQPLDKWEVLVLSRFYLEPTSRVSASAALAEVIGKAGTNAKSNRKRGWRVQLDWVTHHPPRFPQNPFVPRLLMSWSDSRTGACGPCKMCGKEHHSSHTGTIYRASGWTLWDVTKSSSRRSEGYVTAWKGEKRCWTLHLAPNPQAWKLGIEGSNG